MEKIKLGVSNINIPPIAIGCMHMASISDDDAQKVVSTCIEQGVNYFDHADIYGKGESEAKFGRVLKNNPSLRDQIFLESKCGIVPGVMYDLSKEHILTSVDDILSRLQTDHLDMLILHRPDALVEPEEVASAFDKLCEDGKVQNFGVSNYNPAQIELLKKYVKQPILCNQLQFSIPVSNMVSSGLEVNMTSENSVDRDGSVLDYCRLNDITIQAWSPFQKPNWAGVFIGSDDYAELNKTLEEIAEKYNATSTMIAAAWILRHPAKMQVISGSMNPKRITEIIGSADIKLTREEWYRIYISAKHILP